MLLGKRDASSRDNGPLDDLCSNESFDLEREKELSELEEFQCNTSASTQIVLSDAVLTPLSTKVGFSHQTLTSPAKPRALISHTITQGAISEHFATKSQNSSKLLSENSLFSKSKPNQPAVVDPKEFFGKLFQAKNSKNPVDLKAASLKKEGRPRLLDKKAQVRHTDSYQEKFFKTIGQDLKSKNTLDEPKKAKVCFSEKYEVKGIIGEGSNAVVKLLIDRTNNQSYAMKSFKSKENWPGACTEAQILNRLHHPNIIKFEKLYKGKEDMHMILEFFEGTTLEAFLKINKTIEEERAIKVVKQILNALGICHDLGTMI